MAKDNSKAAQGLADRLDGKKKNNTVCPICQEFVTKPVSFPCQDNVCYACFLQCRKRQLRTCPLCRKAVPLEIYHENPRVNTFTVGLVRMAKAKVKGKVPSSGVDKVKEDDVDDRPDEAFTTARAKRNGLANAASGKLKMTCGKEHFGPIGPEFDPINNQGVEVGSVFDNRMLCRMSNVHRPLVAGIAGQASQGAQSVVIAGGYEDDLDEGDYFLYTGSGGKDLRTGNKRNAPQSMDQVYSQGNLAIKTSCELGLPVRVVRSSKDKHSIYAPKRPDDKKLQGKKRGKKDGARDGAPSAKAKSGDHDEKEADAGGDEEAEKQSDAGGDEEAEKESGAGGDEEASDPAGAESDDPDANEDAEADEEGDGGEEEAGEEEEKACGAEEKEEAGGAAGENTRSLAKAKAIHPVRYDGIYRVAATWRCKGKAGFLVCRYLFVRCDNAPAPWSSEDAGDEKRYTRREDFPACALKEIKEAEALGEKVFYMTDEPYWDYNEETKQWGWAKEPPGGDRKKTPTTKKNPKAVLQALEREVTRLETALATRYKCQLCLGVANRPVSARCQHLFCMGCLQKRFLDANGKARNNPRPSRSATTQRRACPAKDCTEDLGALLQCMHVNTVLAEQLEALELELKGKTAELAKLRQQPAGPVAGADSANEAAGASGSLPAADMAAGAAAAACGQDGGSSGGAAQQQPGAAEAKDSGAAGPSGSGASGSGASGSGASGSGPSGSGPSQKAQREADLRQGKVVALSEQHPGVDVAVIEGLLEDQGGDADTVHQFLKKMHRNERQTAVAKRKESPGGAEAGCAGTLVDSISGSKAPAAAAEPKRKAKKAEEETTRGKKAKRV